MKKYILGLVLIATLVVAPVVSRGATVEELMAQIAALQAQIVAMQGTGSIGSSVSGPMFQPEVKTVVSSLTLTGLLNGQLSLRSSFNVKVTANDGTIYLLKDAVFSSFLKNTTIANDDSHKNQIPTTCTRSEVALTKLQSISVSNNVEFYVLPAGQSAYFTSTLSCPTNQMFSGSYYGQLTQINYANTNPKDWPTNAWNTTSSPLDLRTSRSIVVVGEKGPWIESVSTTPLDSEGRTVVVKGERLLQVTKAFLDGKQYEIQSKTNSSLSFFVGNLITDGYHKVFLESAVGKSNTALLLIGREIGLPETNVVIAKLSSNSPVARIIKIPPTGITPNVVLGVFNLMSPNKNVNINQLIFKIDSKSDNGTVPPSNQLFNNIRLFDGSKVYGSSSFLSDGSVSFSNLNIPLTAGTGKDFWIESDILTGANADSQIRLLAGQAVGVDSNFSNVFSTQEDVVSNKISLSISDEFHSSASCPAGTQIGDLNADGNIDAIDTQILSNNSATSDFLTRHPCADVKATGLAKADAATIQTIINCQTSRACGTFPITTTNSNSIVPVITSISPTSGPVGTVVRFTGGTNMVSPVVNFRGDNNYIVSSTVDSNYYTTFIVPSDAQRPGTYLVSVTNNQASGGATSNSVPFTVVTPITSDNTNLIKNGDFSAGQTSWTFLLKPALNILRNFDDAYNTSNPGEVIYQTVLTKPGSTYGYGGHVKSDLKSGICQIDVYGSGLDTDVINSYGVQDKDWTDTFVAKGNSVQLRLLNRAVVTNTVGSPACSFDNVYLKPVTTTANAALVNQLASALEGIKAIIKAWR